MVGEAQGFGETSSDAASSSDTAAFGQDDSEFNIFTTDRQLSALQTAAKMLGTLNEKKVMVIFASGINLNGVDNQAQLHATENTAIKANVSFWPVDARGLVAMPPMGDATQRTAGRQRPVQRRSHERFLQRPADDAGHAVDSGVGHRR